MAADLSSVPGMKRVAPRRGAGALVPAALAAAAWPPVILTLFIWPPENWASGVDTDWRLVMLAVGLIAAPIGLWVLLNSHEKTGRPSTRLGVVGRFTVFGGLLAAAMQTIMAVVMATLAGLSSQTFAQGLGAIETALLIYGVGGLPLAIMMGVSYALWGGVCVAWLAFAPAPPAVKNRMGVLSERDVTGI